MPSLTVTEFPLGELSTYHRNPRVGDVSAIVESLRLRGQFRTIVVNVGTHTGRPNEILAGNHTFLAARELGWETIAATTVDVDDDGAAQIVVADNRLAQLGGMDDATLASLLSDLSSLEGTGYLDADLLKLLDEPAEASVEKLMDRFGAPPMTVLSSRGGDWQERKRTWNAAGIQSELGRDGDLVFGSPQTKYLNWYDVKNEAEAAAGHALSTADVVRLHADKLKQIPGDGTSVFDPVLCELMYSWFSAVGQRIIDPWAGGSVRGLVAAVLGREYVGIELRGEQITANQMQLGVVAAAVEADLGPGGLAPEWRTSPLAVLEDESFDLAFSAAPSYAGDDATLLTPIGFHGGVLVKRDDTFSVLGSRGGKVRTCLALARAAKAAGIEGLVTAGSRQSPQVNIVTAVARALGMKARVHVPAGEDTPEVSSALAGGAEVVRHKAGYNNVIVARAREDAAASGWAEIPFGMECPEAVGFTAGQVASLLELAELPARIVVPVGSGMSVAGVLRGLADLGLDIPVLGVTVGADPTARLDEYAPGWRERLTLVPSGLDYHDHAPSRRLGDLWLDPIYEAKCLPFLERGDLLWVVGIRETAVRETPEWTDPLWVEGESSETLRDFDAASFDLAFGCPPYYDLEKYSDDPRDMSNMTQKQFDAHMAKTLQEVARVLRPDSFAVFVVGSVRDKRGRIMDMRRCMSDAASSAGMWLVNDAVLTTPVGNAAMRAGRTFDKTRVLSRVHQEVLVFVKGDRKRAAARAGAIEFGAVTPIPTDE